MQKPVYLLLQNGDLFTGVSFGACHEISGEVVFTTAMTGYLETLTDPSYYGQIVLQTFPLIGNYGVIPQDFESRQPFLSGYIVREWCQTPSNFRCQGTLDAFLKEKNIPGICGIDTRKLTKTIREAGVMNGKILYHKPENPQELIKELSQYQIKNAVASVSRNTIEVVAPENPRFDIILWDFGAKQNIIRELLKRSCKVTVVPHSFSAEEILSLHPDGIMLSNGPGDPSDNPKIVKELRKLCKARIPIFGICLGHQLLALSQGSQTQKLKYGHRGANQPVKNTATGRVYISSQNHGYAVVAQTLPSTAKVSYLNANDNTCEGISYCDFPGFSVQFHPEACGGPQDTAFLFDDFIHLIENPSNK